VQTTARLSDAKRMKYHGTQFYFKSREELAKLFPGDAAALDATVEIAERCNAKIEMGKLHFPTFDVPEGYDQKSYLVKLGHDGLTRIYGVDCENPRDERERGLLARFDYEIGVIEKTGFVNYFLVVQDFVNYALTHGIPVGPGRGSGAGSILAYTLNITRIDPIRFDLIFERFLNPERVSPPDFDIDFCQARRERVIRYVKEKYGEDRVAQIVTFGQLGAKTVIRDVARVLEIPISKATEFCKQIPEDPKMTLAKAKTENPAFAALCQTDPELRQIMRYAEVLEGLYRNAGVHAAGVVIGDQPLVDIVPLGCDKDGAPVTQYAKEPIEECGLLKMDFLGLKTLTVLQEAVDLIREIHGLTIDLDKIPLDDAKTFELFRRADTVGVFQLESGGMQRVLRDLGPTCIEEIIAILALYRPGPMDFIPLFIKRKKGEEAVVYDHPLLEPVVRETYGIMVYQEQVQRAANVLAGYSLGQADMLRRAKGKKKKEVMEAERSKFVEGCGKANNIPPDKAGQIFDNIEKFAGYGFNKAHAAAYGIVTYQTAYLKAHYPAEFMAAQISSEIGNFDKLPGFVAAASDMGMPILPPDVNHSSVRFMPEGTGIRFGLAGIKSVGEGAAEAVVAARKGGGAYKGLVDLCSRVDAAACNKRVLDALAKCGAMDCFGMHRGRIVGNIDFALARAQASIEEKASGQANLFDALADTADSSVSETLPECPAMPEKECLKHEREFLGVYMTGHPLDRFKRLIRDFQTLRLSKLTAALDGKDVRVAALASDVVERLNKTTKQPWAVLSLDDGEVVVESLVFAEPFAKYGAACVKDQPVLVCGQISARDEQPKIMAREVYPLAEAPMLFGEQAVVSLKGDNPAEAEARLAAFRDLVRRFPGSMPFMMCLVAPNGRKVMVRPDKGMSIDPSPEFVQEADRLLGVGSLRFIAKNTVYRDPSSVRRTWGGGGGR